MAGYRSGLEEDDGNYSITQVSGERGGLYPHHPCSIGIFRGMYSCTSHLSFGEGLATCVFSLQIDENLHLAELNDVIHLCVQAGNCWRRQTESPHLHGQRNLSSCTSSRAALSAARWDANTLVLSPTGSICTLSNDKGVQRLHLDHRCVREGYHAQPS